MSISTVTQPIAPNWSNINCNSIAMNQQPYAEYYISSLVGNYTNNQLTGDGTAIYSGLAPGSTSLLWSSTYTSGGYGSTAGYWNAPKAGKYQLSLNLTLTGITAGHTFGKIEFLRYSPTASYKSFIFNPAGMAAISTSGDLSTSFTWVTHLDEYDSISCIITISGGQKVVGFANVGSEQYNNITLVQLG